MRPVLGGPDTNVSSPLRTLVEQAAHMRARRTARSARPGLGDLLHPRKISLDQRILIAGLRLQPRERAGPPVYVADPADVACAQAHLAKAERCQGEGPAHRVRAVERP